MTTQYRTPGFTSQYKDQLNSVSTTVSNNSAEWESAYASVSGGDYITADTILVSFSATNYTVLTNNISGHFNGINTIVGTNTAKINNMSAVSGNWNSVYTTVTANSAIWGSAYTTTNANSAKWDSVYATTNTLSSRWENAYTTANTLSSKWDSVYTTTNTNSGNWNSTFTTVSSNSASWISTRTIVNSNSANWNTVYTTVNANSAKWVWQLSGTTIQPVSSTHTLTLPYLAIDNNGLMYATSAGLVQKSTITISTGPTGGSVFNMIEFSTDPLSGQLLAGDIWITNSPATTGKLLKYWDGAYKYSVELSRE